MKQKLTLSAMLLAAAFGSGALFGGTGVVTGLSQDIPAHAVLAGPSPVTTASCAAAHDKRRDSADKAVRTGELAGDSANCTS